MSQKIEHKKKLFNLLKQKGYFWSGSIDNPQRFEKEDDMILIHKALLYLDPEEKNYLFNAFNKKQIKKYWREKFIPQNQRYSITNWIIGVMFFNLKITQYNNYLKRYGKH